MTFCIEVVAKSGKNPVGFYHHMNFRGRGVGLVLMLVSSLSTLVSLSAATLSAGKPAFQIADPDNFLGVQTSRILTFRLWTPSQLRLRISPSMIHSTARKFFFFVDSRKRIPRVNQAGGLPRQKSRRSFLILGVRDALLFALSRRLAPSCTTALL